MRFFWSSLCAFAITATGVGYQQAPPSARGPDIPWGEIAAAAGLPPLSAKGPADLVEVRFTSPRALSGMTPAPYVRVVLRGSDVQSDFLVWWQRPGSQYKHAGERCAGEQAANGVCTNRVASIAEPDLKGLAVALARGERCDDPSNVEVTSDSPELRVQISDRGRYQEYSCYDPRSAKGPGAAAAQAALGVLDRMVR